MIIFTSGFPFSGKTLLLDLLAEIDESSDKWIRICPKDYRPDNYDQLSEEEKTQWSVSSWEICLEETVEALNNNNDKIIILDTAAAKVKRMRQIFSIAKIRKHTIVYIYVHTDFEDRKERTEEDIEKYENYYAQSFKVTIPHLKMLSDKFMIIRNNNDKEFTALKKFAQILYKTIEEIRS